jgi:hypothetical protein
LMMDDDIRGQRLLYERQRAGDREGCHLVEHVENQMSQV